MVATATILGMVAKAQDGATGLDQATTTVKGYFDSGAKLMYAVCGLVALIGAVHVYSKWSKGDHDTKQVAGAWLGACIFLVTVTIVIKSFFGL